MPSNSNVYPEHIEGEIFCGYDYRISNLWTISRFGGKRGLVNVAFGRLRRFRFSGKHVQIKFRSVHKIKKGSDVWGIS